MVRSTKERGGYRGSAGIDWTTGQRLRGYHLRNDALHGYIERDRDTNPVQARRFARSAVREQRFRAVVDAQGAIAESEERRNGTQY